MMKGYFLGMFILPSLRSIYKWLWYNECPVGMFSVMWYTNQLITEWLKQFNMFGHTEFVYEDS
jgi:hypothetical protein